MKYALCLRCFLWGAQAAADIWQTEVFSVNGWVSTFDEMILYLLFSTSDIRRSILSCAAGGAVITVRKRVQCSWVALQTLQKLPDSFNLDNYSILKVCLHLFVCTGAPIRVGLRPISAAETSVKKSRAFAGVAADSGAPASRFAQEARANRARSQLSPGPADRRCAMSGRT